MKRELRIVFMGTPDFAVESLNVLLQNNYKVVAVVTAPDRRAGRGRKLQMSPVKKFALQHNLPVLQPKNLKSKSFLQELTSLNHNLQVVVAFRMLPEMVFSLPKFGCFNLHASLLPQYRGAAPINWAIINGESVTGVTTFFIKKKIDTGSILFQQSVNIKNDETAGELHDKLMAKGAELVLKTCETIANGTEQPKPQETMGLELNYAPKIFREDCEINWNQNVTTIFNFIRGLSPYPTAWTLIENKNFKLFRVKPELADHHCTPGTINTDNKTYLKFAAKNGWIHALEVQVEGKRKMTIKDFLRGNTIKK